MANPTNPNAISSPTRCKSYATVSDTTFASDSVLATPLCRKIYVGGAGALTVVMGKDDSGSDITNTILAIAAGTIFDLQASGLKASGSTATNVTVFA